MSENEKSLIQVVEKPRMVERAYLVGLCHPHETTEHVDDLLDELADLADTLGVGVVGRVIARLREPRSRFLLGEGKAAEIIGAARALNADVIMVDEELTPSQQRNWERKANLAVIDRQEVILDIFAKHARTREAELQVALARAKYDLPRLTRRWTHLHRQRGASGGAGTRGEGEQQIEMDSRMVRDRIRRLDRRLENVRRQRAVQRKQRNRSAIPQAAVVGYTNAGKSSLLRQLTGAGVHVEDKLFATLDSTVRKLQINQRTVLLSDTVGFVRKLPHQLVEAFHSTLEEAVEADFLVEVLDVTSAAIDEHHRTTAQVLRELGAWDKTVIHVFNKIDRLDDSFLPRRLRRHYPDSFFVSARTGEGMPALLERIEEEVARSGTQVECLIPHSRYDLVSYLHRRASVLREEHEPDGVLLTVQGQEGVIRPALEFAVE